MDETMCDNSCSQGGGGGTRRCYRHRHSSSSNSRRERRGGCIRRSEFEAGAARPSAAAPAGEDGRSVHQTLCGGIVAGVLFGGVLGGVVVGAAAIGASIVSRRSRDRGGDDNAAAVAGGGGGGGGNGARVSPYAAAAAAAAAARAAADAGNSGGGGSGTNYSGVMSREQAMLATGRAINTTTTLTYASAFGRLEDGVSAAGKDDCGDGDETLPSAHPVSNPVAIPCTSRSIRRARRLTAVTATPASNNLLFSMGCADDHPLVVAPAAGALTPGAPAPEATTVAAAAAAEMPASGTTAAGHSLSLSLMPGGAGGGSGGGGGGGSGDGNANGGSGGDDSIADTARRWWQSRISRSSSEGGGGGDGGGGSGVVRVVSQMDFGGIDDEERSEDGEEDEAEEDWWAGEEFEEDFLCLFEAYCPEGGGGRMPCLVAREPLQGSGVSVRVARAILRIADWDDRGDLGPDEFSLAMYLCRRYRLGEGIPSMLEAWMIPPSLRETRGFEANNPSTWSPL